MLMGVLPNLPQQGQDDRTLQENKSKWKDATMKEEKEATPELLQLTTLHTQPHLSKTS